MNPPLAVLSALGLDHVQEAQSGKRKKGIEPRYQPPEARRLPVHEPKEERNGGKDTPAGKDTETTGSEQLEILGGGSIAGVALYGRGSGKAPGKKEPQPTVEVSQVRYAQEEPASSHQHAMDLVESAALLEKRKMLENVQAQNRIEGAVVERQIGQAPAPDTLGLIVRVDTHGIEPTIPIPVDEGALAAPHIEQAGTGFETGDEAVDPLHLAAIDGSVAPGGIELTMIIASRAVLTQALGLGHVCGASSRKTERSFLSNDDAGGQLRPSFLDLEDDGLEDELQSDDNRQCGQHDGSHRRHFPIDDGVDPNDQPEEETPNE